MKFIDINEIKGGVSKDSVKQDLKFKTGKFVWRVKFSTPLDPKTINSTNLYVTNEQGTPLASLITYDADNCVIEIEPKEAYSKDSPYFLYITKNVRSKGGKSLSSEVSVQFQL